MKLRDYQISACQSVHDLHEAGTRSVCLVAPTGSGKTVMATALVRSRVRRDERCLFVAHRRELIRQSAEKLQAKLGPHMVGAIAAGCLAEPDRQVQVASIQTMLSRGFPDRVDYVVTDEAHHYAADDWSAIDKRYPNARIVGLTATPQRSDGRPLGDMFQELAVAAQYSTLIEQGHIVPCRVFQPENGVKSNETAKDPLVAYRELCPGALAFGFAPRVQHCTELADRFSGAGIKSSVIEAGTPKAERDETLRRFARREILVLWSVNALTEGVDVPQADCAILAKRFLHCQQYIQACGRVLRPYPGKTVATIIDLTGATLLHGFPTEDREYSLDGDGMRRTSAVALRTCLQCGLTAEAWRAKCPGCGFEPPKVEAPTLKIWDHKLREVFAGMGTPIDAKRRELERLVSEGIKRGWAPYFIQKEYSKLFGELPVLDCAPPEMRERELERLRELRAVKGHKPGWVAVNYKRMFGVWPS